MTPIPTTDDLKQRSILDLPISHMHIIELVERVKDEEYARDKLSGYLIGLIVTAVEAGIIKKWACENFQLPFKQGLKIRKTFKQCGAPTLDHRGKYFRTTTLK